MQKVRRKMLKVRLPRPGDDFYMDGYPRSGNTFCLAYTRVALPSARYAHHLHNLAPLKLALSHNIPCVVLLRNPKDCIPSHAILKSHYKSGFTKDPDKLKVLIDNYITYYQFVYENRQRVKLLPFEAVIDLSSLNAFYRENLNLRVDLNESQLKEIEKAYKERQGNKPVERKNNPSEEKNIQKQSVYKMIVEIESFATASKIYQSLIQGH
jgi:hypothetical protein